MPTKPKAKQSTEAPDERKNSDSAAAAAAEEEPPPPTTTTTSNPCCCSFAVTGEIKTYQSIFICRTCCADQEELFCVCEACANHCHEYHDEVDYLGMGMAYCDCSRLVLGQQQQQQQQQQQHPTGQGCGCKLQMASKQKADHLKIPVGSIATQPAPFAQQQEQEQEQQNDEYIMDAYSILDLQEDPTSCQGLIRQASELIQHSRETFWLDANSNKQDQSKWTDLEHMAWAIFQQTITHYGIQVDDDDMMGGAEWWVQVKKASNVMENNAEESYITELNSEGEAVTKSSSSTSNTTTTTTTRIVPVSEAIDLHYDKDETLAEKFGLGSFPTLSTVTYLTSASNPTIILSHTYEQEDDEVISEMLVSHPQLGKHLVFDGRLLHGAPSHSELRNAYQNHASSSLVVEERVTLLVNIWANRKPAGVHPLSREIQKVIQKATKKVHHVFASSSPPPSFVPRTVQTIELEEDLEGTTPDAAMKETKERIELPFVGKGTTWESEDDDESEGGLVIVTCPPPKHASDTIRVRFGPGLQAYLDHPCHNEGLEDPNTAIGNGGFQYEDAYI